MKKGGLRPRPRERILRTTMAQQQRQAGEPVTLSFTDRTAYRQILEEVNSLTLPGGPVPEHVGDSGPWLLPLLVNFPWLGAFTIGAKAVGRVMAGAADAMAYVEDQSDLGLYPSGSPAENSREEAHRRRAAAELRDGISEGCSSTDLELLKQGIAQRLELHPIAVDKLAKAIEAEIETDALTRQWAAVLERSQQQRDAAQGRGYTGLLPERIATALSEVTRYLPTTELSEAALFLPAIATAAKLGTQIVGSAGSGFIAPVNFFVGLIAASGQKKSPTLKATAVEPLAPLIGNWAQTYEQRLEDWRAECKRTPKKDHKPMPQRPVLYATEYTGEALTAALQQNEQDGIAMLIYRDELAGLFGGLNQYRGGRGADTEQLLELFDGGGSSQLRVVGGGRFFRRSQLSIVGAIQPDVLQGLVADGDPNGLWARFMFVPLGDDCHRLPDDDDGEARQEAADDLRRVLAAISELEPRQYRLSRDARALFNEYELACQQAAGRAALPAHSALAGKRAAKVLRAAGALHLADIGADVIDHTPVIPDDTVERAIELVDALDRVAFGIHADAAGGGGRDLEILRAIHRASVDANDHVGVGGVRQRLSKPQRAQVDAGAVAAAMRALAAAGYGEVEQGGRGGWRYLAATQRSP